MYLSKSVDSNGIMRNSLPRESGVFSDTVTSTGQNAAGPDRMSPRFSFCSVK